MLFRRRRVAWHFPVLLLGLALTIYFAVHASTGRYGYEARDRLENTTAALAFEIDKLQTERGRLAHDVALLRRDPPDSDMIASMARQRLGFVHRDDRVLRLPAPKN